MMKFASFFFSLFPHRINSKELQEFLFFYYLVSIFLLEMEKVYLNHFNGFGTDELTQLAKKSLSCCAVFKDLACCGL